MTKSLWQPGANRIRRANMVRFMEFANMKYGHEFSTYEEMYAWSIEQPSIFWEAMWEFGEIKFSRPYDRVVTGLEDMLNTRWFPGARMNFAQNLLRFRDERTALIFKGECAEPVRMSYASLYDKVARLAKSLRDMGIGVGDRVAGLIPNMAESVIAMLATTGIGAIWSSCSPDFGAKGVIDRFGQIQPKVLIAANGYFYGGKMFDCLERVAGILDEIKSAASGFNVGTPHILWCEVHRASGRGLRSRPPQWK